jgi:hypothetical protein
MSRLLTVIVFYSIRTAVPYGKIEAIMVKTKLKEIGLSIQYSIPNTALKMKKIIGGGG